LLILTPGDTWLLLNNIFQITCEQSVSTAKITLEKEYLADISDASPVPEYLYLKENIPLSTSDKPFGGDCVVLSVKSLSVNIG
jgi:hypothetical protein